MEMNQTYFTMGGAECIGNAAEFEGQILLNYSCNLSCFLCWNVLHKGSFSTSEELNLKIVSRKSQTCVRGSLFEAVSALPSWSNLNRRSSGPGRAGTVMCMASVQ